jgi:hypothetical protein
MPRDTDDHVEAEEKMKPAEEEVKVCKEDK